MYAFMIHDSLYIVKRFRYNIRVPYEIYLKKGEEARILAGSAFVYANEVSRIDGKDKNGSLATVRAHDGRYLGKGYINHASKILVRIFLRGNEEDGEELFFKRIHKANSFRRMLGYDDCYRAVFGEADDLPAVIVDKYGEYLSVQILSLGMYLRKKELVSALVREFSPKGIYERSDVSVRKKEGLPEETGVLYGEVPDEVEIHENGLKLLVNLRQGQKTGYFLDQKENRLAVRRYARGEVLDCFCNSGGFSLNAAAVADRVTAVDVSASALGSVMKNAALNGFTNIQTVCADAFAQLRAFREEGRKFDLVILDPPAFCKSAAEAKDAVRGYEDINFSGFKLVKEDGFLMTCSCSHYVPLPLFEKTVAQAARRAGKRIQCVETRFQAPDHPILFGAEETSYLKSLILRVL